MYKATDPTAPPVQGRAPKDVSHRTHVQLDQYILGQPPRAIYVDCQGGSIEQRQKRIDEAAPYKSATSGSDKAFADAFKSCNATRTVQEIELVSAKVQLQSNMHQLNQFANTDRPVQKFPDNDIQTVLDNCQEGIMSEIEIKMDRSDNSELAQAQYCVLAVKSLLLQVENKVEELQRLRIEKDIEDSKRDIERCDDQLSITQVQVEIVNKAYAQFRSHLKMGGSHGAEMVRKNLYWDPKKLNPDKPRLEKTLNLAQLAAKRKREEEEETGAVGVARPTDLLPTLTEAAGMNLLMMILDSMLSSKINVLQVL